MLKHPRTYDQIWMPVTMVLGTFLRWIYLLKTPDGTRSHDFQAHLDYVRYIADHWKLPAAASGWEFHQPPLFYGLDAMWWKLGSLLGRDEGQLIWDMQIISFVLSCALVPLSYWIGLQLFSEKRWQHRLIFTLLIAVFPSLLFTTSRISNDVLSQVFAFVCIGFLLEWWNKNRLRDWYALSASLALWIVTKLTALLFLPVIAICAWKKRKQISKKHFLFSLFILIALTAWLPIMRLREPEYRNMIPQSEGLDKNVLLPNTLRNFVTFNPIQIVQIPYNDPWDDATRRQFFWEYFFRSAFLGEWNFGDSMHWISTTMTTLGLGLLILTFYGWSKAVQQKEVALLPMATLSFMILAGALLYRIANTCSCSQDFRFSTPLIVPFSFAMAIGALGLPRISRWTALGIVTLFVLSVLTFIILLPSSR
jgi:4-amino-4-deoxy-L-arabinose transferase-like glycosyltransferase